MNEILVIHDDTSPQYPINGRELHEQLGVETPYHKWFPRMCEYGFEANKDFLTEDKNVRRADGTLMPQTQSDHMLTLSMAKEICMIQRSDIGRQIRRYLIEVENAWNTPEQVMSRALRIADETIGKLRGRVLHLEAQTKEDAPKVLFATSVECSNSEILVGDLAKILKQNGADFGQKRLFERLRRDGYLISRKGSDWNMPTQKSMELGLMRIKESAVTQADGHVIVNKTTKITGKGQIYFVNRYVGSN